MLGTELMKRLGGGGGGPSGLVDIKAASVANPSIVAFQLKPDGFAYSVRGDDPEIDEQLDTWIAPQSGMSQYDARATLISGSVPDSGLLNTWSNLGSQVGWSLGGPGPVNSKLNVEIRLSSSGAVVDSAIIFLRIVDLPPEN